MICSSSRRSPSQRSASSWRHLFSSDNNLKGSDPKMEVGHDSTSSNTRQLRFIVFSHLVLRQHQLHLEIFKFNKCKAGGSKQPRPFRVDHNCQKAVPIQTCFLLYFQNYLHKFYSPIDRNHNTFRDLRLEMWRYKSIQLRLTFPSTWHSLDALAHPNIHEMVN